MQLNIYNKNLLKSYTNGNSIKYSTALYIDFDCDTTKKYVLSFIDNSVGNQYYRNEYFIKSYKYYSFTSIGKRQTYYFTAKTMDKNSNAYVAGKGWGLLKCEKKQTLAPNFTDVMLEEVDDFNSQPSEYEPIKNQAINIDLKGNKLCAVSDTIKDKLLIDKNGNVALQKNVIKINFPITDKTSWKLESNNSRIGIYNLNLNVKDNKNQICNYFSVYNRYAVVANSFALASDFIRFRNDKNFTDITELKTWLSENDLYAYCEIATPELIDLGQLTELPKTFGGINNIWAETNLGNTEIEIEYVQDVKKLLKKQDARLDNIEALLSTTETSALLLDNMQNDLESEVK